MCYHSDDELLGEGDTISQGSLNARYEARLGPASRFGCCVGGEALDREVAKLGAGQQKSAREVLASPIGTGIKCD